MPSRILRAAHFTDAQVLAFFEAVMTRWTTNAPLMAVGGFSYSYPSEEWRRAVGGSNTFFVSSATLSARDAAFSIHFRRSRDGTGPDEISVSWSQQDTDGPDFPAEDAAALQDLTERLERRELPPASPLPLGLPSPG